jgi:hypothetical protein
MRTALGIGLTTPHDKAADRMLATLVPLADRCVAASWSLWLRAWPSGVASDVWVLLSALLERFPKLSAGVVASFPAATRVSDIEDLLVVDNLCNGRLELAVAPDAAPDAVTEVLTALRGEPLRRPDPAGTLREFLLTPRAARGAIATWVPTGAAMAWRLDGPGGAQEAVLVPAASFTPQTSQALQVIDAGALPSVEAVEKLIARGWTRG